MNYYRCENKECKQKYCGWGVIETCQRCGGKLKEIPEVIFYHKKKEEKEEIKK